MAQFSLAPPEGTPAATISKTSQDANRGVYREEDKLRNRILEANALWKQVNKSTLEGVSGFNKAVKNATKQLDRYLDLRRNTPTATGLKLDDVVQRRFASLKVREAKMQQLEETRYRAQLAHRSKERFESDRERRESRLQRLREKQAERSFAWLREDRAGPTQGLNMGDTGPLKTLSRAQLNKIGKVTSPLIGDAITEFLAVQGNTAILKPLSRAQLNKIGKATGPLLSEAITEGLITASNTMPMKPFPFLPKVDRGPLTVFNPVLPPARKTTKFGKNWTTRLGGGRATTGLGVGDGVEEEGIAGAGVALAGIRAASVLAILYAGKRGYDKLKQGREWMLDSVKQAQMLTTNYPTGELGGGSLRGRKSISGTFGATDYGTMGPTTVHEVIGMMNDVKMRDAFSRGGVSMSDWPKLMASYGVRGGLKESAILAASASADNDLGFRSMQDWMQTFGTLKQKGYSVNQITGYTEGLRGALQVGGANNLSKDFIADEIHNTLLDLGSRGNVNAVTLPSVMGSYLGGTNLPSLRTPGAMGAALSGIQGAEGGVVQNPYLFNIMAQIYKKNLGGKKMGDSSVWMKAFGGLGPYSPMLSSMNGLPLAQQIGILGQTMAFDPTNFLSGITSYFKDVTKGMGPKGKAIGYSMETNVLAQSGISRDQIKDLIWSDWYGTEV